MLKLFNTLTRKKEIFKPIKGKAVRLYTCGPTVYDYAHIGNMRAYVWEDLLRRVLEFNGFKVLHVMNITDVGHLTSDADAGEDKMEIGAKRERKTAWEIAGRYTKSFFEDTEKLKILKPHVVPKATDHIKEMIELIHALETKGFTYVIGDGVYFDTSKFKDYGKLSGMELKELQAGARVEFNPQKKNATDFALWKFSPKDKKRDMEWESPWGKGFPGWHIECSAMSMKYLGETFDIHCGGVDHIPVHHSNEIAQAEAATGKKFVRYWLHCEHLLVDSQKMSKSLGNFYTLRDLLEKGHDPLAIRFLLMNSHYRQQLNFTLASLEKARETVAAINDFAGKLRFLADKVTAKENTELRKSMKDAEKSFVRNMNDDLNVPQALAAVFDMTNRVNAAIDSGTADKKSIKAALVLLSKMNSIFSIIEEKELALTKEEQEMTEKREQLRKEKKFKEADEIRSRLKEKGVLLEDTPYGPRPKKSGIRFIAPKSVVYPFVDDIREVNKKVLQEIKVKKADRSALMPGGKLIIETILKETKEKEGDIFDKAVILLKGLVQRHPFESGNRRTAMVVTASFLEVNEQRLNIAHNVKVLQGIREDYYQDDEIKSWLKGGEIRDFERFYQKG